MYEYHVKKVYKVVDGELILNKDVNYRFVPDRLGHDRAYRLNSNKLLEYYKNKNIVVEFKDITNYLKELYQ
jgi:dTDP-D-glucose 4,6-dehydratase